MKKIGTKKKKRVKKSKPREKAMPSVGGSDKVWIGEQDARTLAESETILGDPKRKKEAIKQAKNMAKKKVDEAKAMLNVARHEHVKKSKKARKKKGEAAFSE
jgi:hypothetical protein